MATPHPAGADTPPRPSPDRSSLALDWSLKLLIATAWLSGAIFALYILAFYIGALGSGTPEAWNATLSNLYSARRAPVANWGMAIHFLFGAVLLLLGPVQLLPGVRQRWPRLHRTIGWIYAPAAILTGLGGLGFIALRGTIGGPMMSAGFAIYGILTVISGVETVRHAVARRLAKHRAWAIRLFALAIGSWLYRMDYGFWFLFVGKAGHTAQFDGPFDHVMAFWFYVPHLILAEIAIRAGSGQWPARARNASAAAMAGAALFLLLATYFFTLQEWAPATLGSIGRGGG